jgi:hypothetical protein
MPSWTLKDLSPRHREQAQRQLQGAQEAEQGGAGYIDASEPRQTALSAPRVIYLPIQLTNGNTGRGHHWIASAKRRKAYEQIILAKYGKLVPPPYPQHVAVTRLLGKGERLWDYSSGLRGNYKELEDAMTACGFWHDDGPRWVRSVAFIQDDSRRHEGPGVRLELWEADDA